MPIEEVEQVLLKYKKEEEIIEKKLELRNQESIERAKSTPQISNIPDQEKAEERNRELLLKLEMTKGNLRSKAIFSPMEMQWKKICDNYRKQPSLTPRKWSCSKPVFV